MARTMRTSRRRNDGVTAKTKYTADTAVTIYRTPIHTHQFTRLVAANDLVKTVGDIGTGVAFTMADLPDVAEFQALFDTYKLDWVDYTFILKSSGTLAPIIYFAEDHDNDSIPTLAEMCERQSTQVLTFSANRPMIKYRLRPNPLRLSYAGGVASGYERAPNGTWLDFASPSVNAKHYGVKYFISNYNSTTNPGCTIQVQLRYGFTCKETQ